MEEARLRAYELSGQQIHTIYIGGGTPSLIPAEDIGELLSTLRRLHHVADDVEITIECNPGDLSHMDIRRLSEVGVNRFSIGAQTFQPELLRFLTRRHSSDDTRRMVQALQEAGVHNYSLDLIYGIPGETLDMLHADLQALIALAPTHISAYHLMYEQGTPLTTRLHQGDFGELPEEESLQMIQTVSDTLRTAGYEHYEVSNYARSGYRSRHNSSYWQGVDYQGLGPSAHSFVHPWRSWDPPSVRDYIDRLHTGARFIIREYEFITTEMSYMEYILTRMRTIEGLSLSYIRSRYGMERSSDIRTRAFAYIESGHLSLHGDSLSLTPAGLLISDAIIEALA